MRSILFLLAFACGVSLGRAAEVPAIEQQVGEAIKSPGITVVHFWAPWCPNCRAELVNKGWRDFLAANPEVQFIFVTTWSDGFGDGKAVLARYGVGPQKNFQLVMHPNGSRDDADKMTSFLGLPVFWLPQTWVFRKGRLRYALNYGEVRFPMLQQLIRDSSEKIWDREDLNEPRPGETVAK